jgi:hypothetical protein
MVFKKIKQTQNSHKPHSDQKFLWRMLPQILLGNIISREIILTNAINKKIFLGLVQDLKFQKNFLAPAKPKGPDEKIF